MSNIRLDTIGAWPYGRGARRGFRPVAAAVALALGATFADGSALVVDGEPTLVAAQQRGPVTLEQAQKLALARFKGRVAGAKTVEKDGRNVHEIRIIGEDNLVRTFRIDAQTGAFL
jgi:hypothetical protein